MSTTDLKDFDCDDLMNDYIDYVNTGTANAMAIASQDTGSMINSVRIDSLSDGYYVYSSPSVLRALSHEKSTIQNVMLKKVIPIGSHSISSLWDLKLLMIMTT